MIQATTIGFGMPKPIVVAWITLAYTLGIAYLMVSRLPVLSGKQFGSRVAPEQVLPVFILVVLFIALLIAYPWPVLTIGTLAYLASLPYGLQSYREQERRASGAKKAAAPAPDTVQAQTPAPPDLGPSKPSEDERPARLN